MCDSRNIWFKIGKICKTVWGKAAILSMNWTMEVIFLKIGKISATVKKAPVSGCFFACLWEIFVKKLP